VTMTTSSKHLIQIAACAAIMLSLNGCAALAVSLAGAGAGAGISHQVNGTASRTFSEPMDRVDSAVLLTSKRLKIDIDTVEAVDNGQITKGKVGDLVVTIELQTLSSNLTRVNVTARKNMLMLDGATAQEIVAQMEHSLSNLASSSNSRSKTGEAESKDTRYTPTDASSSKKSSARSKKQNTI
jgi:hypothetical protein